MDTWKYRGKTITVDDGGTFWVNVDDQEHRRGSQTLEGAKGAANEMLALETKERHVDMAMPVIDDGGNAHTIRGLNRSSGKLLGVPDRTDVYYPTPVVEALLRERRELNGRLSLISVRLSTVRIADRYGGGRIEVEEYDDRITALEAKYAAAMVAAEDIVDPPVVTGLPGEVYTPGPWQASQWSSGNWHITPVGTDRPLIVSTEYQAAHGIDAPVEEANACLIAAAPDLLAAIEALTDPEGHILHGSNFECTGECREARAAIAKATGAA